jgi:hypothetical protein
LGGVGGLGEKTEPTTPSYPTQIPPIPTDPWESHPFTPFFPCLSNFPAILGLQGQDFAGSSNIPPYKFSHYTTIQIYPPYFPEISKHLGGAQRGQDSAGSSSITPYKFTHHAPQKFPRNFLAIPRGAGGPGFCWQLEYTAIQIYPPCFPEIS